MSFNPKILSGQRFPAAASSRQAPSDAALIASAAGTLYHLSAYHGAAGDKWLALFDAAAVPDNAVFSLLSSKFPASGWIELDFGESGIRFYNGLVAATCDADLLMSLLNITSTQFLATYDLA
jgi:hypothetical protein